MIRTVVTPDNQEISLHIPKSYVGKKIEVIAFEIEEVTINAEPTKKNNGRFWGSISDEIAAELHRAVN